MGQQFLYTYMLPPLKLSPRGYRGQAIPMKLAQLLLCLDAAAMGLQMPGLDSVAPHRRGVLRSLLRTSYEASAPVSVGEKYATNSHTLSPLDFGADPTGRISSSQAFAQMTRQLQLLAHNRSVGPPWPGQSPDGTRRDLGGAVLDLHGGECLLRQHTWH